MGSQQNRPHGRRPLTARDWTLAAAIALTVILVSLGALTTRSLLNTSLSHAQDQAAAREARLVADLGLGAALVDGAVDRRDLRLAVAEYAVAHRDLPLTGVALWLPTGNAIFAAGSERTATDQRTPPRVVRAAQARGTVQVAIASDPPPGAGELAAVPLGQAARHAVAEFEFSRAGIEHDLQAADGRLLILVGIGAVVLFVGILPLLVRLVRLVPLPEDPSRLAALSQLKLALVRRELILHYQPKADMASGQIVGVEALVRWQHPQRGLLGPAAFLPLAESSPDLLAALTCQVLDQAIGTCTRWLESGRKLPVAVNVPVPFLLEGSLVSIVRETLARYQLEGSMLTLELTETLLTNESVDVVAALRELRGLGVSISIDDFGTGHSSLARLRALPIDELKVDRSFVCGITTDARELGITRHIVGLGLDLGLRVVAEGVEDKPTLELLGSLGCGVAQGFLLARPMAEAELEAWLERPPLELAPPPDALQQIR